MKYLVLLLSLFMFGNVKADYNENIDYQTNALRSFIQETVEGVPTKRVEPIDLSDLPLRENREDVSDAIPYDKYRTTAQKVGDFAQDLGATTLGGMAQIVPTAMQVGAFVPRQVNSLVGKTADALGLDSLELATKEIENKIGSSIDNTYSGIRQGVEELTSDYGRYASQKGFQWDKPFSDESLYVLSMYVAEFIGMAIPWVILFFVLRKYIFYKPKRAEKKNADNTVSDTNVEQTSSTNANEVNDVSKQPQEQTHVFNKGVRKNMNKKVNHFFVILFLFIITILGCYWLGYLFSDFTKEFLTIFVKHRNLFSPKGFRVLLSIFMLIGILYLIVYIIYTKKYKKIPLLMSGKTKE